MNPTNNQRRFLIASSSVLAAGVAQGTVQYSGVVSNVLQCPSSGAAPAVGFYTDLNNDGIPDFYIGFDGYSAPNAQKPFIAAYPTSPQEPDSAVIGRYSASYGTYGLPVTAFGTVIGPGYLTADLGSQNYNAAYFNIDGNTKQVGDWLYPTRTEGYVGLQVFNTNMPGATTNYAWAHMIYDATATPATLTLVDYAYETSNLVGIVAGATTTVGAPVIYTEPASQTAALGARVQLQVTALGNPVPTYQWRVAPLSGGTYSNLTDGSGISGSTSNVLTINGVSPANALNYIVVVSNSLGAVTSAPPAALNVVAPVAVPTPQVLYAGLNANFSVNVAGSLSATYHWRQNGVNLTNGGGIAGSSTSALTVNNIQSNSAGNYDVVVTAGSLVVTSSVAHLTVLPSSGESLYQSVLFSEQPLAYYGLNETANPATNNTIAYDNVGAYNGIYAPDVSNGFTGVPGPRPTDGYAGFSSGNVAASFANLDTNSLITLAPWNINTNNVTFTAWINPNGNEPFYAAVVYTGTTNGSQAGLAYYWANYPGGTSNVDVSFVWGQDGNGGGVGLLWDSGLQPPTNVWSLIAATVTSSNVTIYDFSTNGVTSSVLNNQSQSTMNYYPGGFTNSPLSFSLPELIGSDPRYTDGSRAFNGTIDEVAIFNRTLGSNDLQTLFNAAQGIYPTVTLNVAQSSGNVQLTWGALGQLQEASNVTGPWTTDTTATSPYIVATTNSAKFYRVKIH